MTRRRRSHDRRPGDRPDPAGAGWDPRDADRRPERHREPAGRAGPERRPRGDGERGAGIPRSGRPILYGFHTVAEAIANPRRVVHAVYVTANAAPRLAELTGGMKPAPTVVSGDDLTRLLGPDAVHQGVAAEVDNLPALGLHDLPDDGVVVMLDQVTDPHNVGAILRSAAAFGATGLVMTERHSPEATGVLAKTASGALEHVPLVVVGNLAQALAVLGERGFWRIGLDSDGEETLARAVARPPVALVLGAEGKGLRRLTRERCDALARLDVPGKIRSLNVSNAAAVSLYAVTTALAGKP
ncbi:23S rRNA (guanosine(2251)-2'-O)-methyltransferase RlmB [Alsobacter sp. R-9]